ncbi:hypothetical protein E3J85_00395 [Patescibacteria group bacterium]|nr:MAG: hypothetical protein E3J85_00395 [Patescibacteria group bacterium]
MKKILQVRIEGLKNKPFWELYKESYSKEILEDAKGDVFFEELSEIGKRYPRIHRIEFIIEVVEEPIPFKGDIDPKLVREAEEEVQRGIQ